MLSITKTSLMGLALAAALVTVPSSVSAQDAPQPQVACTAQIQPASVAAGTTAVPVRITVSQTIGEVTGVEAAEGSGIALASASDLPRQPLAGGAEPPRPIAMGDAENQWVVFLNLADAEAGSHEVTFTSDRGQCAGRLTIQ
jgi:hypothetical protein